MTEFLTMEEVARLIPQRPERDSRDNVRDLLVHWAHWLDDANQVVSGDDVRSALRGMAWSVFRRERASVYFVRVVGREIVKIGISVAVVERLADLQAACPDELELIAELPGGRPLEKTLHAALRAVSIRNEWFWLGYPILKLIEMACEHRDGWVTPRDDGKDEWSHPERDTMKMLWRHGA